MTDSERPAGDDLATAMGHTIQVIRTERRMSRGELAKRAGISYSYLAAIENGAKSPSTDVSMALAEVLGVQLHELYAAAEARREAPSTERPAQPWRQLMESARPARQLGAAGLRSRAVADYAAPEPERTRATRSDLGAITELRQLLPHLDDDDLELLLQMARKLADRRA